MMWIIHHDQVDHSHLIKYNIVFNILYLWRWHLFWYKTYVNIFLGHPLLFPPLEKPLQVLNIEGFSSFPSCEKKIFMVSFFSCQCQTCVHAADSVLSEGICLCHWKNVLPGHIQRFMSSAILCVSASQDVLLFWEMQVFISKPFNISENWL